MCRQTGGQLGAPQRRSPGARGTDDGGLLEILRRLREAAARRPGRQSRRRPDAGSGLAEPLTDNEISSIIFGLSFAGHETTTNQLANCIWAICDHGLWQQLRADRDLIPGVVEESLRQVSSVIAWRRIAVEDTTIGDTPVPKGAKLLLSLAGANRDPDVFLEPDAFNPGRNNTRAHLSFGKGIHLCLGAHLARMEIGIVLNEMLDRFGELRLDASQELEFPPNVAFWGSDLAEGELEADLEFFFAVPSCNFGGTAAPLAPIKST